MSNHPNGMIVNGLMADPFKDTGHGYPGGSRDFWMVDVECECTDCVCNSGYGTCAVPSLAKIGKNGKCKGYQKRK